MKPGDSLKVIDAAPKPRAVGKTRKPPFAVGAVVKVKAVQGSAPDGVVELAGLRGWWGMARFAPVEG